MTSRLANLLLLFAGAIWGMGFVAQQTAMQDIGPMAFIGLRFLLASSVLLPFAFAEHWNTERKLSTPDLLKFIPVGVVFFGAVALQQYGIMTTSVTNAGFLTALYVVLVPLAMLIILRERQTLAVWPASILALTGIYLLSDGQFSSLNSGDWLTILCAVFWAFHVILTGKVGAVTGAPVRMATVQFAICGLLGLTGYWLTPLAGPAEPALNWQIISAAGPEILYASLIAGGLAFTLQAVGQQHTKEATAAIMLSTESLFAALFGTLLLGEQLSLIGYLGCALIFASLLLVGFRTEPTTAARAAI